MAAVCGDDERLTFALNGQTWARYRRSVDPNIGGLGALSKLPGFRTWTWGLSLFGVAAIVVFIMAIVMPG